MENEGRSSVRLFGEVLASGSKCYRGVVAVSTPAVAGEIFLDRRTAATAALTFVLLAGCAELVSRGLSSSGALYGRISLSGVLTSLPELEDRIGWGLRGQSPPVLLLGDSVLGASAMVERGQPGARRSTLPSALAGRRALVRSRVVSLAADGLVPGDLEAISYVLERTAGRSGRPARVVLVVNVRMLASELDHEGQRVSRDFLLPALPPGSRAELVPAAAPQGEAIGTRLYGGAASASALFRLSQQLRALWYYPTPADARQRLVEAIFGKPPVGDVEEAALRMRVEGFYQELWREDAPAARALRRLVPALRRVDPRLLVVFSPQNPSYLAKGGPELPAANADLLRTIVGQGASGSFVDLSAAFGEELFLDHCHMTAEGNLRLAEEIDRLLGSHA